MTTRERGLIAFASQGLTEAVFNELSEARQSAAADLVAADGKVDVDVRPAVAAIVAAHYAELKATTKETDELTE